jgi:transposase
MAVLGNRRRVRGPRGKRLQRGRSELTERSFAHVCETGGARRCWLRGLVKVSKRYLLQVAARNLSLIMRKLFGVGTPRGLQSESDASSLTDLIQILFATLWMMFGRASNALRSLAHLALETLRHARRLTPAAWNS